MACRKEEKTLLESSSGSIDDTLLFSSQYVLHHSAVSKGIHHAASSSTSLYPNSPSSHAIEMIAWIASLGMANPNGYWELYKLNDVNH